MDINEEHRKRREGNNARARFYKAKDEILGDFKFIDYIESSKYISKMHGDFNKAMELDEDLAWSNRGYQMLSSIMNWLMSNENDDLVADAGIQVMKITAERTKRIIERFKNSSITSGG